MKTKNPAKTALDAFLSARGYRQADEADARDLITDLILLMRKQGKDVDSELRMALSNANAGFL